MEANTLLFFTGHEAAFLLYEKFEKRVLTEIPDVTVKVQKTQITFYNRHLFACVSFAKVRKAKERPPVYIVVTFGLSHRVESPRIDIAIEPYPNRWTHHVLISSEKEIDDELIGWVKAAADFSDAKK